MEGHQGKASRMNLAFSSQARGKSLGRNAWEKVDPVSLG